MYLFCFLLGVMCVCSLASIAFLILSLYGKITIFIGVHHEQTASEQIADLVDGIPLKRDEVIYIDSN